jgi:hypothetical protein
MASQGGTALAAQGGAAIASGGTVVLSLAGSAIASQTAFGTAVAGTPADRRRWGVRDDVAFRYSVAGGCAVPGGAIAGGKGSALGFAVGWAWAEWRLRSDEH